MTKTRNVVTSWSDWDETVKQEVPIPRPGGEDLIFPIYAVSEKVRDQISQAFDERMGPKPEPPVSRKLMTPKTNDPKYLEALAEWEKQQSIALDIIMMQYLNHGWAIPNDPDGVGIPGDTDEEKLDNLRNKVAGDLALLYKSILILSNLKQADIDFFLNG